jgi:predicted phage baseplate assembly protein
VLEDEVIEVRELEGPRAAVELPLLREEIGRHGLTDADLRLVTDPRSGQLAEVWVRWRARPTLLFSRANDRDFALERSRGRIVVGDGERGELPPPGRDNIRMVRYRTGGGLHGNVPAGALRQALSGVPAKGVTNPRAAEGGADGEAPEAVRDRGPLLIRHRRRACSADDYEALAREASPGVAVARALSTTAPNGRPAPGWVRLIIVPQSHDPRPQPSFELRRRVREFIRTRGPASLGGLAVVGPEYRPIGIEAVVVPRDVSAGGPVRERALQLLGRFLHPLTGGPDGAGWPFGRDVYLSDVAACLERVPGVDHVLTLNLLLDDTPQGAVVQVPPDRIVVAGPLEVRLASGEA